MERVIEVGELAPGERRSVFVDDVPALVIRIEDQYFVVEDVCSHDGQPLTNGAVEGFSIECPRHAARFDLRSGKALSMPAIEPIRVFQTEIREGAVWAYSSLSDASTSGAAGGAVSGTTGSTVSVGATEASATTSTSEGTVSEDVPLPTELDLIESLKQVIDPELMVNIVDLGLVYAVNQNEGKVTVQMTLTSPACPAGPQIVQQAKMALERLDGVSEAVITLTMSPPWTPDRMTDDAKDQLGIF